MTTGDCVLTNYGVRDLSGAALKTIVDTVNLGAAHASGAQLFLLNAGNAQAQVIKVSVTGW